MSAGIEVRNNVGDLVIDGTYRNLVLISKSTTTTTTVIDQFSYVTINLNGLTGYPVVAVQSASGAWATVQAYSNGNATVDIVARGSAGTTVTYFVFVLPTTAIDAGGFQVFDASGQLVFSAGHHYMRVAGSLTAHAGPGSPDVSLTLPAGKTYAVFQTTPMAYSKNVSNQNDWYLYSMRGCFAVNGNLISKVWGELQISHWGSTVPPFYDQPATGFVLDVSGY